MEQKNTNHSDEKKQPYQSGFGKIIEIAFWFGIIISIIGVLFRIQHWQGAAQMLIIGILTIAEVFFLKSFQVGNLKGSERFIHNVKYISLAVFSVGFLFQIMHWPGGIIMKMIGLVCFIFVFILTIFQHYKYRKTSTPEFYILPFMLILFLTVSFMYISKDILNSNLKDFEFIQDKVKLLDKNSKDISSLINNSSNDSINNSIKQNAQRVSSLINEQVLYIDKLKQKIINTTEMNGTDTTTLRWAIAKDNYDIPTYLLIGDDDTNPADGEFTALDLKKRLNSTYDNLNSILIELEKANNKVVYTFLKERLVEIKPNDDPGKTIDGNEVTWEIYNFYHQPLVIVISKLTQIQYDLKNTEFLLLNEFKNQIK
jgi:hypothetical protein